MYVDHSFPMFKRKIVMLCAFHPSNMGFVIKDRDIGHFLVQESPIVQVSMHITPKIEKVIL